MEEWRGGQQEGQEARGDDQHQHPNQHPAAPGLLFSRLPSPLLLCLRSHNEAMAVKQAGSRPAAHKSSEHGIYIVLNGLLMRGPVFTGSCPARSAARVNHRLQGGYPPPPLSCFNGATGKNSFCLRAGKIK